MLDRERECGELPSPICPGLIPLAELNRDLLFSGTKGIFLVLLLVIVIENLNLKLEDEDGQEPRKKAVAEIQQRLFCFSIFQARWYGAR